MTILFDFRSGTATVVRDTKSAAELAKATQQVAQASATLRG